MSRTRWLGAGVAAGLVLAGVFAGLGYWWYHTSRPKYRLQRGQAAVKRGDFEEAQRQADRLEASGYLDEAHLLRGQRVLHRVAPVEDQPSLRKRYLAEAIAEYNQIRHENEEVLLEASLSYGLAFLSLGLEARAEKLLLYVAQVQPDNVEARQGLASIYYDRGAMTHAVAHLKAWSELDPSDGQPHRFMGLIYKDYSSDAFAIKHYKLALEGRLKPAIREEVLIELAEVLAKKTEYAEALTCLDGNTFETEKAQAALPELRAVCLYGLERSAEAVRILQALIQEGSPTPRALRLRAQIHMDSRQYDTAVSLLRKALEIDPHDAPCRYQFAMAYGFLGRQAEAAAERNNLEEAQTLHTRFGKLNQEADDHPTDVQVRRQIAELAQKLGKFELAQAWQRAADACQTANQGE